MAKTGPVKELVENAQFRFSRWYIIAFMDFEEGSLKDRISENLKTIKRNIAEAAERVGRRTEEITVIAVTKTVGVEAIRAALECGIGVVGENRVQEARAKFEKLGNAVEWHYIGHLQKNKVKYIFDIFSLVHSVDSYGLAEEISRRAAQRLKEGEDFPVLLQVDVGEEKTKHGIAPLAVAKEAEKIARLPRIRIEGLMAIPPFTEDAEKSRPYFKRMREIRNGIIDMKLENIRMDILSYGMTGDYGVAVEEGATHVRIGTGIFGER